MKLLFIQLFLIMALKAGRPAWDWREVLLKEAGIEDTPEALRKALANENPPTVQFDQALKQLNSSDFSKREEAQKELQQGGEKVYQWLSSLDQSPDPEVRIRIRKILSSLGADQRKPREDALRFAIKSLLKEGDQRRKDTSGRFYEWFGEASPTVAKGYHLFDFANTVERDGAVKEGRLWLSGKDRVDGDQRLVLKSQNWPGNDSFGDNFEVSARLGGGPEMNGSWHLGLSIGRVRALYHPGYRGGGFRFETIGDAKHLSKSTLNMGFTPSGMPPEKMIVRVRRLPDEKVRLVVTLVQGGEEPKTFQNQIIVEESIIGPLNQIGLDRSGRTGADAFFTDFSVVLNP